MSVEPVDELTAALRQEWVQLLDQALSRIDHCVSQLDDQQVWCRPGPGQNSIGNLLLHLAGNLQQWAVEGIPQLSGNRQREAEFAADGTVSGEQLLSRLRLTVQAAAAVIEQIPDQQWTAERHIQGFQVTVLGALMHTVPHFVGHTHQIVQLARMQLGSNYRYHWTPESPRNKVPL